MHSFEVWKRPYYEVLPAVKSHFVRLMIMANLIANLYDLNVAENDN